MRSMGLAPLLLASFLVSLAGCGSSDRAQLDRARNAVEAGLTAWQKGQRNDNLMSGSDPIQFREDYWMGGMQLTGFKILRVEVDREQAIRCFVTLSLKDRKGKTSEREVAYAVKFDTPIVITRDPYF